MLVLSVGEFASGLFFLATNKRKKIRKTVVIVAIGLMIFLQILAIVYNLTGSFNLAKIFITNGFILVVVAFLVFWTARF